MRRKKAFHSKQQRKLPGTNFLPSMERKLRRKNAEKKKVRSKKTGQGDGVRESDQRANVLTPMGYD